MRSRLLCTLIGAGVAFLLLAADTAEATRLYRITYTGRDENWGSWAPNGYDSLVSSGQTICDNGQWFCGPQNIWAMRFGGRGELLSLEMVVEGAYHPRISPDGTWVAAMIHNGHDYDIWVWPFGRFEDRFQFQGFPGAQERFPNWSNDSQYIAFDSERPSELGTTGYQVYYARVEDAADPSAAVQATLVGSNNKHPTWNLDGTELAFVGDAEDRRTISAVHLQTGVQRVVTPHGSQNRHPDWSPDGNWIAFTTDRWDGIGDIAIVRADGTGEPVRITEGMNGHDDFPEWSGDGTRILFCGTAIEFPYLPNKEMYVANELPTDIVPAQRRSVGGLKGRFRRGN